MHGETASAAAFARRLVKEQDAGHPVEPVIDKMNALAQQYHDQSRPVYCAKAGFVDEITRMATLRDYFVGFCKMLLSKSGQYLPAAPDAATEIHQGVGVFMTPAASIKTQKSGGRGQWSDIRSQKNEYPASSIQYPVKGGGNERI